VDDRIRVLEVRFSIDGYGNSGRLSRFFITWQGKLTHSSKAIRLLQRFSFRGIDLKIPFAAVELLAQL
jgi:hypothetical protein